MELGRHRRGQLELAAVHLVPVRIGAELELQKVAEVMTAPITGGRSYHKKLRLVRLVARSGDNSRYYLFDVS